MAKSMRQGQNPEELVRAMVRLASHSQIVIAAGTKEGEILLQDIAKDKDLSYDHWVSVIFVSGEALRMTFRAHFSSKDARCFAARGLGKTSDEVAIDVAHDFIREFCNLTAGAIKRCLLELQDEDRDVRIGLPEQYPSYDGVDIRKEMADRPETDFWALKMDGKEIICAANIEVFDWSIVENIKLAELPSILVSSDGDIEFL